MTNVLRVLMLGVVLSSGVAGSASAAEEKGAAKPAASGMKVGDTVHVCGCGEGCHCGAIKAEPGKCGCGQALIPAKVTKVEGGKVTVDRGGKPGETTFTPAFK